MKDISSKKITGKITPLAGELRGKVEGFLNSVQEDLDLLDLATQRRSVANGSSLSPARIWKVQVTPTGLEVVWRGRIVGTIKATGEIRIPEMEWFEEGVITRGYFPEDLGEDLRETYIALLGYMFPELSE